MGPRQTMAVPSSTRKPMDMQTMPCLAMGLILFSVPSSGRVVMPSMRGCDGPKTSASNNPTFNPSLDKATARLTEVVDFPTPPLPEATATTALMLGTRFFCTGAECP